MLVKPLAKIPVLLENIRIQESIFTLPFAYLGMVLAARGLPTWHQFLWITVAMVGARTYAMSMNRLADRDLDRRNPRAAARPLPSGRLSVPEVALACLLSTALLLLAAWQLNPLCVALFPVAMVVFTGYSYVKRVSWLTHVVLGIALGGAPVGGWIGVTGELTWEAVLLGLIVMTWATGFDTLYACGDAEQDSALGVRTIPIRFGVKAALMISAVAHVLTLVLFVAMGVVLGLGWPYWVAIVLTGGLLTYQHSLVTPDDLSRLNVAFFTLNGAISILVFALTFMSLYL